MKCLWFLAFVCLIGGRVSATEKPNILFLLADDFSYEALGCLGKVDIDTPHLDRLAHRGVLFTHAYNMGAWNGAVCVASRNMLLTGRTVWRAEKVATSTEAIREAGQLWPGLMKSAGYDTYMTGKWHIQANAQKSFDVARNVRGGMPATREIAYDRPVDGKPDPWDASDRTLGGFWEGGKHWTEVAADDAIDYLEIASESANPFFMYVAFNAPHDPRQAPQEFLEKYPVHRMAVPDNFLSEYPYKDSIGCGVPLRDERLAPFPRTQHAVRVHRREYYALISHLDEQIGRILDALEASPQAKNTWIIFTADHGLAVGHHGLFGKQNMYDHSLRVPVLVAGPNVPAGTQTDTPIYLQDVMATTLELAGAKGDVTCEFQSFASTALGQPAVAPRKAIYAGYLRLQRCVIHDGWKLILYPKAQAVRLYHLETDPGEQHDLADDESLNGKKRELFRELLLLQAEFDDPLDLPTIFPDLVEAAR